VRRTYREQLKTNQ